MISGQCHGHEIGFSGQGGRIYYVLENRRRDLLYGEFRTIIR